MAASPHKDPAPRRHPLTPLFHRSHCSYAPPNTAPKSITDLESNRWTDQPEPLTKASLTQAETTTDSTHGEIQTFPLSTEVELNTLSSEGDTEATADNSLHTENSEVDYDYEDYSHRLYLHRLYL